MYWLTATHRYLGITAALFMVMWCLSGFVMMYVPYPALPELARLKGLEPIDWADCCHVDPAISNPSDTVSKVRIEMLAGHPVLQFTSKNLKSELQLSDGTLSGIVSETQASSVAHTFAQRMGLESAPSLREVVNYDEWTVSGAFNRDRPLYRYGVNDAEGTELYISSKTGAVVQITTAKQRFWNWLGAIPHWLYFAQLRHNVRLWSQVVIWTAVLGCFLTATGLCLGIRQFTRSGNRFRSPYRGVMFWHHVPGLIFGIFALTWVASGLISMNPWGFLDSEGPKSEREHIEGQPPRWVDVASALQAISRTSEKSIVSVTMVPLLDKLYFVTTDQSGQRARVDQIGAAAPLAPDDIRQIAMVLGSHDVGAQLLLDGDDYYYGHHSEAVVSPVYRIVGDDPGRTRYYIDALSSQIVARIDTDARGYRWLFAGFHRLDFTAALRARPLWDLMMLVLLAGVTCVCGTGAYLAVKRMLRRPVHAMTRRRIYF